MSVVPPTRRRGRSRRRTLALLVASGLALVGVVVLGVGWAGIGITTLRASAAGSEPCLAAYEVGSGVEIRYELLPARAVCVRDVDGTRQEVVVASVPTAVTVGGLVLALGGIAGTVAALLPARGARDAAPLDAAPPGAGGPVAPAPPAGTP
ncbi:hypothetical protein [Cellulomonas dongxiuzhuiae]|uniref:DUF3592 domain-containing protein n=1 Tax=Cellulomonas dongxiuzhuiae TaxID=2819979 RepID=A0ABX8GME0_9CELL|nr:hypothetical protein [Cellulomonas dongxiuzhuiae]MBO3095743.1 hypothetical protein [Cellulomonas dongxiuzhuiae]QWC17057.1 hypothetical protein KKR89_05465 [Cellulomonas dongxiuzhuiae]